MCCVSYVSFARCSQYYYDYLHEHPPPHTSMLNSICIHNYILRQQYHISHFATVLVATCFLMYHISHFPYLFTCIMISWSQLTLCIKISVLNVSATVHNAEASLYDQWLLDWLNHFISGSCPATIPMGARHILPPLNKAIWQHHLQDYLYQDLVKFFGKYFKWFLGRM